MAMGNGSTQTQAATMLVEKLLGPITNLSATAIIFWMVLVEMPAARADFRAEMNTARSHAQQTIERLAESFQQTNEKMSASIDALTDEIRRREIR